MPFCTGLSLQQSSNLRSGVNFKVREALPHLIKAYDIVKAQAEETKDVTKEKGRTNP